MNSQTATSRQGVSSHAVAAATLIASLSIIAIGSFGPNIDLACVAAAALVLGVAILWRPGEPPAMLFVFLFQWVQASVAIVQATIVGLSIDDFFEGRAQAAEATLLTHIALVALAVGMRMGAGPVRRDLLAIARTQSTDNTVRAWFVLYAVAWIVGAAALYGAAYSAGLAQIFFGVNGLRWAFFAMLAVVHFSRGQRAGAWFPAAFAFELAMSLGGYFSNFKTVFIVTFLAILMAGVRLTAQRVFIAVAVGVVAFGLGIVWTAIKEDYRSFASGGVAAQIVTVGYPERIQKLGELVGELDEEKLDDATQDFLSRLGYVEFFGSTINHVPSSVPHEGGALLLDAITRPFMPRLFFPDKAAIDDSERTRYYTGRFVSGAEAGTSISLGWAAEMYIDFGEWGMMFAALGIGVFYGSIQRLLTTLPSSRGLMGYAMSVAILVPVALLESSITKVIGGLLVNLIVSLLLVRFVVPQWCPWVVRQKP